MNERGGVGRAPVIAGLQVVELLGSGGYADVYLYEQERPRRRVAVKVLHGEALSGDNQMRQFNTEANLMAMVSTHPFIVTVFDAEVSDDGRPYLVMEYYPLPNFLQRARREHFSVAEVLRVGVQVASAVETAHRAGILHRDIKPANILTSEFRNPGLTDFGIAAVHGPDIDEVQGMSVPWSPPESFGPGSTGVAADVYSLAATLYHLLAGRSPFELSNGDNGQLALVNRIERLPVPAIGRADVPASLERILAQAMSKRPEHRPQSVLQFAFSLQAVENELRLAQTALQLADDGNSMRVLDIEDEDETRVRPFKEIDPQANGDVIGSIPFGYKPEAPLPPPRPRQDRLAEPAVADTLHRVPDRPLAASQPEHRSNGRTAALAAAALGVVVAAIVGFVVFGGGGSAPEDPVSTAAFGEGTGVEFVEPIRPVGTLKVTETDGQATFTWSAPGREPGDRYEVVLSRDGTEEEAVQVTDASFAVSRVGSEQLCVEVAAIRVGSAVAAAQKVCTS